MGFRVPRIILLVLLGSSLAADAFASCGAESCSLENGAFGAGYRRLTFQASYQMIDQDGAQIGTHSAAIGEIHGPTDEVRSRTQTFLMQGQFSIDPRLVAIFEIPYLDRFHSHWLNEAGAEPVLHEWQYSGFGDSRVVGSLRVWGAGSESAPSTLSLQAGIKLPTGAKHVDPIDGDEPEPHARLGTGSWDGVFGAHFLRDFSAPSLGGGSALLPVFATVSYLLTSRGTDDYEVGDTFDANLGTSYPVGERFQVLAQANYRWHGRDDARIVEEGEEPGPVENTGGKSLYLTPGFRLQASSMLSLAAHFQVPVYQDVNEIQLVAPYHLWFGATYRIP